MGCVGKLRHGTLACWRHFVAELKSRAQPFPALSLPQGKCQPGESAQQEAPGFIYGCQELAANEQDETTGSSVSAA